MTIDYISIKVNIVKIIISLFFILIFVGIFFFGIKIITPGNKGTSYQVNDTKKKEDINWDEMVDPIDMAFVKTHVGCNREKLCWKSVIGKTVTGDNPIYVFDLDMNSDGMIDQKDVDLIK